MELLNNIWNILSTPNEMVIAFITLPAIIIEVTLSLYFFTSLLNITSSGKQKLIYIALSSIGSFITIKLLPPPFNTLINLLVVFITIHYTFKENLLKTFIAMLCTTFLFAIIGTLIINPFITFFGTSYEQAELVPIYRIAYVAITYFLAGCIILSLRIRKVNFGFSVLENLDKRNKFIIFLNLLIGLITLAVQLTITIFYTDVLPIYITFLSFLSLLAYFGISIYSLTKAMKLFLTTKKLESVEEYNKTLRYLHDNVRCFKHDYDNTVTTIGGYVKTNDMEGLKKYYTELEDECQKVNNLYLLNPEIINNPGIYSLLTNKYYEAIAENIKVEMSFLLDLNTLKMKIYEFAKVLGILLDNAIDASKECEEKIINIAFRDDEKNHRQLIIIENTYMDKDVDTEKIFDKGFTGKVNHTGLGLWEIKNILKKNNNLNLHTTKTERFFKQQLEIYY